MAFPYLFEEGFEAGTAGGFNSESDTDSKLDFPNYAELARFARLPAPYRGSACMRVNLAIGTATTAAYVQENDGFDIAIGSTVSGRFMFWFGNSPVMANNDEFDIFRLFSNTAATVEAAISVNYTTASGYRLGMREGTAATTNLVSLSLNRWHSIEFTMLASTSASTLDVYLDNTSTGTQVGSFVVAAISEVQMGYIGGDAGTTAGVLLFDSVIADDLRIYAPERRFPQTLLLTQSGHVFVGSGRIANIALLAGAATDGVLSVFDTDTADSNDATNVVEELKNTANSQVVDSARVPFDVRRGCYVALSGTNPRALIQIQRAAGYWSDAAIRNLGAKRVVPAPVN